MLCIFFYQSSAATIDVVLLTSSSSPPPGIYSASLRTWMEMHHHPMGGVSLPGRIHKGCGVTGASFLARRMTILLIVVFTPSVPGEWVFKQILIGLKKLKKIRAFQINLL